VLHVAALHGGLSLDVWEATSGDGQADAGTARDGGGSSDGKCVRLPDQVGGDGTAQEGVNDVRSQYAVTNTRAVMLARARRCGGGVRGACVAHRHARKWGQGRRVRLNVSRRQRSLSWANMQGRPVLDKWHAHR